MPRPGLAELIDEVNDHDQTIGAVRRADALEATGFRTAHVFVLNAGGDLLLQELAASRERHPGRWGSSVAAYLHLGESYDEAARRRLREELGIAGALATVGTYALADGRATKFVRLFVAHADDPTIREPDHLAAIDFVSLEEIDRRLVREPERFTPTFRELYARWRPAFSRAD